MPVVHRPAAATLLAALLTAPASTMVHAVDHPPVNLQTRTQVATCANCHHADTAPGTKLPAQALPPLTGHSQAELIDIMQASHNSARPSTVMGQITRGCDGTQIATTADWLSCQPQETP